MGLKRCGTCLTHGSKEKEGHRRTPATRPPPLRDGAGVAADEEARQAVQPQDAGEYTPVPAALPLAAHVGDGGKADRWLERQRFRWSIQRANRPNASTTAVITAT